MTDPRNNFDDDLKTLLTRRADEVPQADLAERALGEARSIRRRRRIGAAVAVAAVIAVAAPVGATLVDGQATNGSPRLATQPTAPATTPPEPPTTRPEPITLELSLSGLDRGGDPSVPYLDAGQWHSDDGGFTQLAWPNGHTLIDVAEFDEGVGVWTTDISGRMHMSTPGIVPGIDLTPPASAPAVDDSTGAVAFALGDTLYFGQSLSADTPSVALDGVSDIRLLDANDGVVVIAGVVDERPMVGRADFTTTPPTYEPLFDPADVVEATAFSLAASLMGQFGQDTVPGDPNESRCAVLTDLDHVNDGGWASCRWRPESFSPDGSRVFALDTRTEGFGPRRAAVLDSATGEVLLDLTAAGTFGFWPSWESNDSVLLTMVEDDAAIIRCTVGVGCELATDPKPAAPDSLLDPYHLTAN
jgi:hypothetical protein